jgi:hypothetical protein
MSTKPPDRFLSLFRVEHGLLQVFRGGYWFTLPLQSRYSIDGRQVSGSKLHWFLYWGNWPEHRIYFADGDTLNYSKDNMVAVRARSIGRLKPYQAVCRDSTGKARHLGYFLTQEERDAAMQTFKAMRASGLV